jgi:acyl-CoA thioester hydrolase
MTPHIHPVRVYYEDTDAAGIVYYANYLRFIERARTEWVRGLGIDQTRLRTETGIVFAVRSVTAEYLRPAVLDDLLEVRTTPRAITGARIMLDQDVWRGDTRLFAGTVTLVCLTSGGTPARLPRNIAARLSA